ncbi:GIY-YIG nuclease family protein [Candidatus Pacearchaeota archaeon]|nr:GIY-YIG nuclease family protein [Candidatus Pacearchaeota archaeon]
MIVCEKQWEVYLVECLDGSMYTGVSNDVDLRMRNHASGRGSKYVRAKGFSKLLARKKCLNKSSACKAEYYVKQLPRDEKIKWFRN